MPTVVAHHDVKDTKHWLASPKRKELFGPLGVTNIRTFVDPQKSTRVGLVMDVADMDRISLWIGCVFRRCFLMMQQARKE